MIRMIILCSLFLVTSMSAANGLDAALLKKADASVGKAVDYLISKQSKNGSWGPYGGMPEFTALVCTALVQSSKAADSNVKASLEKAEAYLVKYANEDGSIWRKSDRGYPNYSTSVSLVALYLLNKEKHKKVILKAREWLKKSQFTEKTAASKVDAGGIGYGKGKAVADLSNTQMALEALYVTRDIEKEGTAARDVKTTLESFKMADEFLSRCQALPGTNDQKWAKNVNGDDVGGFIYSPDRVKVEKDGTKTDHKVYGSMTYAGLKSMIYAGYMKDDKLNKDDPRVKAAVDWASKNYSVDKNPGVGTSGLFYYLQTFSKAMKAYGADSLKDAKGKERFWKKDVLEKLISLQQAEGYWVNENGRWMENVPEMVTAFALSTVNEALTK
ncbi:MAG: terpene cyclase/mutase family protein [Lentisphaeraceae bacterium]|nr:terpene cyclase/mutase family protein [Lentisphaeraceae bacterium]